jgi:plastocyanin
MNFRAVRAVLAAGLLGAVIGCGSSNSSTPTTPSNPTPSPSPSPTGAPVSIVSGASVLTTTAFSPNPIAVAVGGSVTWTNNDNTAHTSTANNGGWNSGIISPGGKFTATFMSAGTFSYHCSIHPGMVGTVNVQ